MSLSMALASSYSFLASTPTRSSSKICKIVNTLTWGNVDGIFATKKSYFGKASIRVSSVKFKNGEKRNPINKRNELFDAGLDDFGTQALHIPIMLDFVNRPKNKKRTTRTSAGGLTILFTSQLNLWDRAVAKLTSCINFLWLRE